jgi:nicotinate-nucleotide pyrophosphorylase (carboxylating)
MSPNRWLEGARSPWQSGTRMALMDAGLDPAWVRDLVLRSLDEDLGGPPRRERVPGPSGHDVTSEATVPPDAEGVAHVVARADGVVAGMPLWPVVLAEAAAWLALEVPFADLRVEDGARVRRGDRVATLRGATQALLVAERTALNLACRVSGIATHTRSWVDALDGTGVKVLDTRKTTPGLRPLEKYAVRLGGGVNKRMGLYDVAMIKDNHILAAGSITRAYRAVAIANPHVDIQVEVTNAQEAVEAVSVGARFLLCDNFAPDDLATTVKAARGATEETVELEATGGLTLEVARDFAATGVDYLSVGALTHSSPILDLALDLVSRP